MNPKQHPSPSRHLSQHPRAKGPCSTQPRPAYIRERPTFCQTHTQQHSLTSHMHPPTHAHMHKACTKNKKKGLGRWVGCRSLGSQQRCEPGATYLSLGVKAADTAKTRNTPETRRFLEQMAHGDVQLKGSNGKLKKTTTEQTFFYVEAGRM